MSEYQVKPARAGDRSRGFAACGFAACGFAAPARLRSLGGCGPALRAPPANPADSRRRPPFSHCPRSVKAKPSGGLILRMIPALTSPGFFCPAGLTISPLYGTIAYGRLRRSPRGAAPQGVSVEQ